MVITLRILSEGCGADERGQPIKDAFLTFLIVSVVYIVTFSLTFGFVLPLQQLLFSGVSTQVSLLFLPHGVRVLTLYFYGWRGMFYLLPVSYLMILLSVEQTGQDLLAPVVSWCAVTLACNSSDWYFQIPKAYHSSPKTGNLWS